MKRLFVLLLLLSLSCSSVDEKKACKALERKSISFFKQENIDIQNYNKKYYIKEKKGEKKRYMLEYYKLIEKDSSIIYFYIEEDIIYGSEYYMDANDVFREKELKLDINKL